MTKINPNRQVTYTIKEIREMKQQAHDEGVRQAMNITTMLPMLVLRDKYGFGKKRMNDYLEHFLETEDAFYKDYITLQDIVNVMQDEIGIDLDKFVKR